MLKILAVTIKIEQDDDTIIFFLICQEETNKKSIECKHPIFLRNIFNDIYP